LNAGDFAECGYFLAGPFNNIKVAAAVSVGWIRNSDGHLLSLVQRDRAEWPKDAVLVYSLDLLSHDEIILAQPVARLFLQVDARELRVVGFV